ncbi:MAG: S9 family peptidase [Candidatus Korarchaeota archaeon]|nr:S9 family peptidase [Candidatus Korarchaeota archaeon]NIU83553.1 prolyl oligopeptidase family serine peptidase [Candidatus Thorarchaeota archaeon]NIW13807.1 prolyl oligopeptidase family serine peptidase [Candidatus Thorarchaeota archaeon]
MKLTNLNSFVERLSLSEPEEFTFRSFDDTEIHGWIMKPKGFDPSKKYPTLLYIKGGPSGQNGYKFNPLLQIGSLKGYVHFYINYRGCSGYGQDFSDAVIRDMGGGEFKDHMEAVDYILKTREYVDAENVGLYGGSYGGYLTNWIVTQTNRFKAAVSISSISNFFSDWGTSAVHFWVESELEGLPWDHMDLMIERSPIVHADKVKTPVLFLQGEKDFCTPFGEAEQMFKALKKIDVETKLVRYLNGSHGLRKKPVNRLDSIRRLFAWFDKHLKST